MSRNDSHGDKTSAGVREKCGGTFSRQELISIFSASEKVAVTKYGHDCGTSSLAPQQAGTQQQAPRKK